MMGPGSLGAATQALNAQTSTGVAGAGASGDLTGAYMGMSGFGGYGAAMHPRIIPNPFDNTLLVQGTPQEWEQISNLIEQIDIPPRQVLIEAKVYEVDLTGAWSAGVESRRQRLDGSNRTFLGSLAGSSLNLSAGMLVGLRAINGSLKPAGPPRTRVISALSVIATDSIAASIMVGRCAYTQLAGVTGRRVGTSLFANTVQNRSTGGVEHLARVNSRASSRW
jgi:general secretion pathway protein D